MRIPLIKGVDASDVYGVAVIPIRGVGKEVDVQISSLLVNAGDHTTTGDEITKTKTNELVLGIVECADALKAGHFGHVHVQRNMEGLEDVVQSDAVHQLGTVGGGAVGGDVVGQQT